MRHTIQIALAIAICLVGFSQPVFAQGAGIEWDILNQEVEKLYREANYSKVILVAEQALNVAEENVGPDHPYATTNLENIAILYKATIRAHEAKN